MRGVIAAAGALVALACAGPAGAQAASEAPPRLKSIDSCGALARYARRHTQATIVARDAKQHGDRSLDPRAGEQGGGAGGGGDDAPDFSETNVQEQGIDEPDRVKTNGVHLFVVGGDDGNVIHALDARSDRPGVVGSVELPGFDGEILLSGNRILALTWDDGDPESWAGATILSEIDVSNPAAMRVLRTEKIDGEAISARLHGRVARVAIWTPPREVVVEQPAGARWSAAYRRTRMRRAVRKAPLDTWRPSVVTADRTTGTRSERGAVPCGSVRRPREYSGSGMLTVRTVDLDRGLPAVDADGIFAEGETVYGGADGLYVATEEWIDPDTDFEDLPSESVTAIHKFAIAGAETEYRASGSVPGYMLSQWSMSEHAGYLRTATTSEPPWFDEEPRGESESQVVVLAERDGALVEVGRARGLGRGERIQAVRFMGDQGFVVTFREVDPLFTLDLSDPHAPAVRGELKIPGYSAYLHPIAPGLLLGVGQDATARGELRGFQLSLFDVSDLAQPRRVAVHTIPGSSGSAAEWDHHAFLHWPATGLTLLPIEQYADDEDERASFSGAIGFKVDPDARSIAEVGRVTRPAPEDELDAMPPERNVVIGERVFSVWDDGVRTSRLDDLSQTAWVDLPR